MTTIFKKLRKECSKRMIRKVMELAQATTVAGGEKEITPGMAALARRAGAEGIVLLRNQGVLPLGPERRVSVFGRCQLDTIYVGYGSGGDVKPPYQVSYMDALLEAEAQGKLRLNHGLLDMYRAWISLPQNAAEDGVWGRWPTHYPEMPVPDRLAAEAAAGSETAVVILGRAAGEDRESRLLPGSYYLTGEEKAMLDAVTGAFEQVVVVLDCGNVMDMGWIEDYGSGIQGIVYAWQGGMEAGHALADVLLGSVNPCGKLTDTISRRYGDQPSANDFGGQDVVSYAEDIFVGYRYFETFAPEKVLFPFGFGLSYTTFSVQVREFVHSHARRSVSVRVRVANTGGRAGREVVQLYVQAPQGLLGKASRVLTAFAKTRVLEPGAQEELTLTCAYYDFASFDDTGAAGHKHAYVLERGCYGFHVGTSVRQTQPAGEIRLEKNLLLSQLRGVCGVRQPFERMHAAWEEGRLLCRMEWTPRRDYCLKKRVLRGLPAAVPCTGDRGIRFQEVVRGERTLDEFIAQLNDRELEALTRGYGVMNAPQGAPGNAGVIGGVIPALAEKGVPAVTMTDGPCGLRLNRYASQLPCGTALASTWDDALVEALYELVGGEMERYGSDVLLGPGMNIHRNPLCGRNFEYFSEDPLLTGRMGAAFIRGIRKHPGKSACPKHLACNNQETARSRSDSRVSERALREIYLKGFEIAVREGRPDFIMTSYNKINGVWSHYHYDLAATVLRQEWGFEGLVITDWWMRRSRSPEFPKLRDNAYRVRAQVDVLMPGNMDHISRGYHSDGTLLQTLGKPGGITRGELQGCARRTLAVIARLKARQGSE